MSWASDIEDMLERAERVASGEDGVASAGFVSRFMKTALDPPRDPTASDIAVFVRALSILEREPFCEHRRMPALLRALAIRSNAPARQRVALCLARVWRAHDLSEKEQREALTLATHPKLTGNLRARFALMAGTSGLPTLEAALESAHEISIEDAEALQEMLLSLEVTEQILGLLALMYERTTWLGRRILLSQLGDPEHAGILPALVSLGKTSDPSTRRAVIQALGRIGHVAAEPYLLALYEQVEPGVRGALVEALGQLGTRLSLEHLNRELQGPLEEEARRAISAIEGRHPILDRTSGGLTLAEDGSRGALSLSGVGHGEISLYERVEEEVTSVGAIIPAQETAIAPKHLAWHRLVAGPRKVPWLTWVDVYMWGRGRAYLYWTLVWLGSALLIAFLVPHLLIIIVLSAGALTRELRHSQRKMNLLALGTPTFAEMLNYDIEEVPTGAYQNGREVTRTEHIYEFSFMDERGAKHTKTLHFLREMPELSDDPLERVLYNEEGDIVLFDELHNMDVSLDGALVLPSTRISGLMIAFLTAWVLWGGLVCLGVYIFMSIHS